MSSSSTSTNTAFAPNVGWRRDLGTTTIGIVVVYLCRRRRRPFLATGTSSSW
jgi:hypothetical protein